MRTPCTVGLLAAATLTFGTAASAEVLVRWDQDRIPTPQSLGLSTIAVPAGNKALIRDALGQGYRVFLEVDASSVPTSTPAPGIAGLVLIGNGSERQLALEKRPGLAGLRIVTLDARGKWPHIRTNWVTKQNDVLQVTSRSAQPWIENNAALVRVAQATGSKRPFLLTYPWSPITPAEEDEGPSLENYLVAIAEAGSFGGGLLLPLHPRLQRKLLVGDPDARIQWTEIRRYLEFFSWDLPNRYRELANIGVVTAEPAASFEVLNLLLRHNLSFELIRPASLPTRPLAPFDLLVVLDPLKEPDLKQLADFADRGGALVVVQPTPGPLPWRSEPALSKTDQRAVYRRGSGQVVEILTPIADPNAFALDVRQLLGRDRRLIDIWNGITVMTMTFEDPDRTMVLVTAVNYAHQPLPVQIRVRGTFPAVHYESPEEGLTRLPYEHRAGYTEVVVPALRVGGRVFLRR